MASPSNKATLIFIYNKKTRFIMNKNSKKRNWAFVVYPESAPENWIDILQETGLQCVISPLHDQDLNPDNTPKKPHYHVIACYSGPTTYNVVKKLADSLNAPIPQHLESVKGYFRYLTHKDNPEKAQYSPFDIKNLNGFNILDFAELTRYEITEIKKELIKLINENQIFEYCNLLDFLIFNGLISQFEVASNNTIFLNSYLSSKRYTQSKT